MGLLNDSVQASGGPDLFDDELLTAELRDKAETAKRTLSNLDEARLFITATGQNFNLTVTRAEFEAATRDLVAMTEVIVEEALEDAGLGWPSIDKVILVGGSTRMPMIESLIETMAGRSADRTVNPDEAVALGAAIQASLVTGADGSQSDVSSAAPTGRALAISDVTSQSLGVIALDESDRRSNSVIIKHNSTVPAQSSRQYSTIVESQTDLHIEITEGDDEDLDYVQIIHQKPLKIPPYPKGAPIEIIMSYDVDATIHVEVRDLTAGTTLGEIELDRPSNLEPAQVDAMAAEMKQLEVY